MEIILDYLSEVSVATSKEEKCRKGNQNDARWEGFNLPFRSWRKGDLNQDLRAVPGSGKDKGMDSPLELPEKNTVLPSLDVSQVKPVLNFWPTGL